MTATCGDPRPAIREPRRATVPVTRTLTSKGISYGRSRARYRTGPSTRQRVEGVDPDLRVRPFFAHGGKISIREFVVGALKDEMGLCRRAIPTWSRPRRRSRGHAVGMVLDG